MKSKYFIVIVALMVLFSLTCVSGSENITEDAQGLDNPLADEISYPDEDLNDDLGENQDMANNLSSDNDENDAIDVSVKIGYENVKKGNKINCAGFEIPFTITVKVNNGTAREVKVYQKMSNKMEYVSSNASMGVFDSASGIWDLGDLTSTDNATLKMIARIKSNGTHQFIANATTASHDIDLSNNFERVPFKSESVGDDKGNDTQTSYEKNKVTHEQHHQSNNPKQDEIRQRNTQTRNSETTIEEKKNRETSSYSNHASNGDAKSNSNENNYSPPDGDAGEDSDSTSNGGSVSYTYNNAGSVSKSTIPAVEYLISMIKPNNNSNDTNNTNSISGTLPPEVAEAIRASDYTTIPIMIFSAFLIILLAIVGYDKIKS